ncbi:alpha/beta hydrolase [Amycolatopsis taiwanensis]|uniref:Esterase n=1 Tax=Amycolatopsis taiwanensis TaxID=342230 RepID=A0A9W6R9C1_9PSEU|nr:alpha/beta hydrolase [Amycolatopsis taiwanensis]GLY71293.1 esterase [Amycolatopsis taiwanensis]
MAYRYDPELVPIVDILPELDISDIPAARALLVQMRALRPQFVVPDTLSVRKRRVPGPAGSPDVELTIIKKKDSTAPAPALYWIHGGGFVLGDADGDLRPVAELVDELNVVGVLVEYRLAPEHPFPAPVEDCYAGLLWTAEHAGELGIDADRLAVGGQSAGGGLAAAVGLLARDRNGPRLCFQVLDIPELDDSLGTESVKTYVDTPLWTFNNAVLSWKAYLGDGHQGDTSPYAAPARADDLGGLPPAYVVTCEFDPLRDEGIDYARRLIQAGVPTELHHYPGTFHGSSGVALGTAISDRMNADLVQALARAFRQNG